MAKIELDTHIHMGCRTLDEGIEKHWQQQDLKNFKVPQGKTIFVFGGNSTNREDAANGNAKVVGKLLTEENRSKVNIYSFLYDLEPISPLNFCILEEYEREVHEIYKKIIDPLFRDRIGNLKERQGIEKVLNNMVFVSHCGGSEFVNIIIDDICETLKEKYHSSEVELLIGKLQYFAYAPNSLPNKKVNGAIITPYRDVNNSWTKAISEVREKRIDVDYPRGVLKRILKTDPLDVTDIFDAVFAEDRMIVFKSEQNMYFIPNRINSNIYVGDHSIDCLVKENVLEANTDIAKTAKVLNYASRLVLNQFVDDKFCNNKELFEKIVNKLDQNRIEPSVETGDQKDLCVNPEDGEISTF